MSNFVGNILQNKFYACCYILLSQWFPKYGSRPKHRSQRVKNGSRRGDL